MPSNLKSYSARKQPVDSSCVQRSLTFSGNNFFCCVHRHGSGWEDVLVFSFVLAHTDVSFQMHLLTNRFETELTVLGFLLK